MDVAWQDSVGSFLDSSGTGSSGVASFAGGDGTLWSSAPDSPLFSSQSVLWESDADPPTDNHLVGLNSDSTGATDTSPILAGGWIADGAPGLTGGSPTLDGGLLWAGAGSDTSASLTNSTGVGLGALDLGAGSSTSQWQQFVNDFAGQPAAWLSDTAHLLWPGAGTQPPVAVPFSAGSQSVPLAPSTGVALPSIPSLSPTQLAWTGPSSATGLTIGPSLVDGAPPTVMSGAGVVGTSSNTLPIAGAGSHS